jgi:Leucine-rich repeat (LRR) protein
MKNIVLIFTFFILHSSTVFAQELDQATLNKVKVHFFSAEKSFRQQQYQETLQKITEIQKLTKNAPSANILNLKVKTLIQLKQFKKAETTLQHLYQLKLSDAIVNDISNYNPKLEKGLASLKESEAKEQALLQKAAAQKKEAELQKMQAEMELQQQKLYDLKAQKDFEFVTVIMPEKKAYEAFLKEHPKSSYTKEIKKRLALLNVKSIKISGKKNQGLKIKYKTFDDSDINKEYFSDIPFSQLLCFLPNLKSLKLDGLYIDQELNFDCSSKMQLDHLYLSHLEFDKENLSNLSFSLTTFKSVYYLDFNMYSQAADLFMLMLPYFKGVQELELYAWNNKKIKGEQLSKLTSLEKLHIPSSKLISFPEAITSIPSLTHLTIKSPPTKGYLQQWKISYIPESISKLQNLEYLHIEGQTFSKLPESFGTLDQLKTLDLSWNGNLAEFPDSMGDLNALNKLTIYHINPKAKLPKTISNWKIMKEFNFSKDNSKLMKAAKILYKNNPNLKVFHF